mmetsp:Transcript_99898/g.158078  ORF Transcript_99898/g.158078 Transcript_99898/m.158078 type:complete len:145 (-) Transcript_99898:143-577(-)|eukprot:CAMPEP_0169118218 /NCGR_PEP_ID=MMETSP1015-20121227/30879_1 /TAXON_ID=342587 /ORGANISM="Karlodinium micrum, Strain CCMP2283" /LENGTH=144 /DNA_ID=CAMNT_0009180963 /DNA_START=46 /DNA_END=480 /DNA_ORIENTATION=+
MVARVRDSNFAELLAFREQLGADPSWLSCASDSESDCDDDIVLSEVDVAASFEALPLIAQVQLSLLGIKFHLKSLPQLTDVQADVISSVTGERISHDTRVASNAIVRLFGCWDARDSRPETLEELAQIDAKFKQVSNILQMPSD